jgi:hypothetical protein
VPQFNALLEVYNKAPLLPYILRPQVYETNQENLIDNFNILPQKALLHVNGSIPVQAFILEYSVFLGSATNGFISSPDHDLGPGYVAFGQSSVSYLSRGGRIGLQYGDIRAGVSIATDHENQRQFDNNGTAEDLGDIPRTKVGADFSVSVAGFTLSAEYLKVTAKTSTAVKDSLAAWHAPNPYQVPGNLDKEFYYLTVQYELTSSVFAYAMIDFLQDDANPIYFGAEGFKGYHLGGGYAVNEFVVLKCQVSNVKAKYVGQPEPYPVRRYDQMQISVGASFSF